MKSIYQNLGGTIVMPEFREQKLYMHKTDMGKLVLPDAFQDYWQPIETMLSKVKDRNNVCYITIDEKRVKNETHRRGGVHVDYNWFENLKQGHSSHIPIPNAGGHDSGYGGNGGTHGAPYTPPRTDTGGHNSGRSSGHNGVPFAPTPEPSRGGHGGGGTGTHSSFEEFNRNGGMLLASNFVGCRVWRGDFHGKIADGGCCKAIDVSGLESEIMKPHDVYFVNALGLHESLKIEGETNRSLIRINFHPDYVWKS